MNKLVEVLLSGDYMGIISLGIIFMLFMSGIMAIIFVNYIKRIMKDLENVSEIKPLIKKVEALVNEIQNLVVSHEITKERHELKILALDKHVEDLDKKLATLDVEVERARERLHSLEGSTKQLMHYIENTEEFKK